MMTTSKMTDQQVTFSLEIQKLQGAIAKDPTDIMAKISLAIQLEQEGFLKEAVTVYQDIIATDTDGVFAASAQQALISIAAELEKEHHQGNGHGNGADLATPEMLTPERMQPTSTQSYSAEILELKEAIAADPTDLMAQISLAIAFENEGFFEEAATTYRYIIDSDQDQEGVFAGSAAKALADLQDRLVILPEVLPASKGDGAVAQTSTSPAQDFDYSTVDVTSPLLKQFQNLSITQKQFLGILLSSFISITGVAIAGISITATSGRSQLLEQASAELAVTDINYNIKLDQMGFGFRGQSDNTAIIGAVTAQRSGQALNPALKARIQSILQNEIAVRKIEYATLVGGDRRILVSANANRQGELFDPNGLVSRVLQNPEQIKTSEIVPWEELKKENPPSLNTFASGQNALIRYTATPVKTSDGQVNGVLISGDVINNKPEITAKTVDTFDGGYSAIYQVNGDGSFTLSTASVNGKNATTPENVKALTLPERFLLKDALAANGEIVTAQQTVDGVAYTLAAAAILNTANQPVAVIVRGTPEDTLNALLKNSLFLQMAVGLLGILLATGLAVILGRAITRPIKELQQTAEKFGEGNLQVTANVSSQDEIGRLAQTFNLMAAQIAIATEKANEQTLTKQKEAEFQRRERERLQESVIRLLLQIEEVRQGDLSIQAQVDAGEVGSIADAFNATLRSLRKLVAQVQSAANQVYDSAIANNQLITNLSEEATLQDRAIQSAEKSVQGIAKSIQSVAKSAQVAAKIARKSRLVAQEGAKTMDETVDNIDTIRGSVADTSKKAKRLAESSQEISKIVSIISDISEKTNLLAFNASIEATRAGENGQGFRVVADEVRRLAEQVTTSAQEIEQLISGIQDETAQMMQMMEESTTQVVTGTELVRKTKTTLQNVARISTEIDKVLASISNATVSQQAASSKVTETMQSVAVVAQKTAAESQEMSQQLQTLTAVAIALQESSSRFKID